MTLSKRIIRKKQIIPKIDILEQLNLLELLLKNSDQIHLYQELLNRRNSEIENINLKILKMVRLKDKFIANMSHDLRTPLNVIIGFAEILKDEKGGPLTDEHKDYVDEILSSAELLLALVNDILDLSKIESGKMEFYPEKIDLLKILDEIKNSFKPIITDKKIKLVIQRDPVPEITIDPNKLKQVLNNLVSNAMKFTREGGKVTIITRPDSNGTFRLEVRDTGIGIQQKDLKHLFVAFHQIHSSHGKKIQGTGLGLALTKSIVKAQGGQIGVESTFGKGSTFYVILPCMPIKLNRSV